MKEDKFVILCRYERWTSNGIDFTSWFVCESNPMSKDVAEELIKKKKQEVAYIDQKTKLKHEYMLQPYSEYEKSLSDMRERCKISAQKAKEYYASDAYKEMMKQKRKSAKELKERQKKYAEEHGLL